MIYLFLIIIFCLPIFYRHKIPFFSSEIWYWGECVLLILVAGLRLIVGGDTQTYMGDYDRYPTLEEFNILLLPCFATNHYGLCLTFWLNQFIKNFMSSKLFWHAS